MDRLGSTLRQYLLDLVDTRLDAAHVEGRRRIAEVHDRIDLPIDAYQAQLQAIREVWTRDRPRGHGRGSQRRPLGRRA